jgi:hypothetical protein
MSDSDIQRLYDTMSDVVERLAKVETIVTSIKDANIDVSRLRWDGKAINYVIMKVIAPVLITVLLGGSAFYYGIHMQVKDITITTLKLNKEIPFFAKECPQCLSKDIKHNICRKCGYSPDHPGNNTY